jgi:hypothetical protein
MNLAQLAQQIAEKIGMADAKTVAKIRGWIRSRYETVWQHALWRDACTLYSIAVAAGASHVTLADEAEAVTTAGWDRHGLLPAGEAMQLTRNIEALLDQSEPTEVADVGRVGLPGDPEGGLLTLETTDASETVEVTLMGPRQGIERRETVSVTHMPVSTTETYDLVRTLSKTVSTGSIIVRRASDGVEIGRLHPEAVEAQHVRVRLMPAAKQAGTLLLVAKRRVHRLTRDSDVLVLRGCVGAVEAFAHGDALEWMRQYAKAATKFSEAQALLAQARDSDVYQPARMERITPVDPVGSCIPWR